MRIGAPLLVLVVLLLFPLDAESQEDGLTVGLTGQTTLQGWENPVTLLRRPAVEDVVLAVAESPRTRRDVEPLLEGEPFSLQALVDAGILEERDGRLHLDFILITESDVPVLARVRGKHGRILAEAFRDRWGEVAAALGAYDLETVPREVVAYIMIGAFSLDWDGLDFTAERGWRDAARLRPNGDRFRVWAEHRPDREALRGLFWGSHNATQGEVRVTTFGDHYALPRNGFPDLAWRLYPEFRETEEALAEAFYPGSAVVARDGALDWVAAALLALRDGPLATEELAQRLGRPVQRTDYVMRMLVEARYVTRTQEGAWAASIPVLDQRDVAMTRSVILAGREVMGEWAEQHMDEVFEDLEGLVAVQHGVPPEVMMTRVWHHIFAGANAALVEAGLLADPYAKPEGFRGFFPVVWTLDNRPATILGSTETR